MKSIDYTEIYGPEYAEQSGGQSRKATYSYSYDEQGRIVEITEEWNGPFGPHAYKHKLDYDTAGEIVVADGNEQHRVILNNQGNVAQIHQSDGFYTYETKVEYTEDGRLGKLYREDSKDGSCIWYHQFSYTDGLLTKAILNHNQGHEDVHEFGINEVYPNRLPATGANIDFNAFIYDVGVDGIERVLCQIGLLGNGSDALMELAVFFDNEEMPHTPVYDEPGKVYKSTQRVIKYGNKERIYPVKYEFDGDRCVTEFSSEQPYEVYEYYCEIHVGHELLEPGFPEMGYDFEIKNEKWTKLYDEKNAYTYTVVYE